MIIFLDTSAWVKYFLNEAGSLQVQSFLTELSQTGEQNRLAGAVITYAEMIASLKRACKGQRISEEEFENLLKEFQAQWNMIDVVEVHKPLIERAGSLAKDYALRGCDAFQLASALETQATILIGCDLELNQAARQCGLQVWNPEIDATYSWLRSESPIETDDTD